MNPGFVPNYDHSERKKTKLKKKRKKDSWDGKQLSNSFRRHDKDLTLNSITISSVKCARKEKEGHISLRMPD